MRDENICRQIAMLVFWFGIAALFALFVWTIWAASGAVLLWARGLL